MIAIPAVHIYLLYQYESSTSRRMRIRVRKVGEGGTYTGAVSFPDPTLKAIGCWAWNETSMGGWGLSDDLLHRSVPVLYVCGLDCSDMKPLLVCLLFIAIATSLYAQPFPGFTWSNCSEF